MTTEFASQTWCDLITAAIDADPTAEKWIVELPPLFSTGDFTVKTEPSPDGLK